MVRVRDFNPPPSYTNLFYRWIGVPRPTGFDIYIGDYAYGVGLSVGKRMRYKFPARQGFAGKLITPSQTIQRGHFRAALDIWNEQPDYTPFESNYGQKGRNWWWGIASGFGWFTIDYFMHMELPFQIDACPSPWNPTYYLNLYDNLHGIQVSYQCTPALEGGTYRATMLKSDLHGAPTPIHFIIAATIYEETPDNQRTLAGHIGDFAPDEDNHYAPIAQWAGSVDDAWDKYLNDSLHTYQDVAVDPGNHIAVRFRNAKGVILPMLEGHLEMKVEKQ